MNQFNLNLQAKIIDFIRGIFVFIALIILSASSPVLQSAAAQNAGPSLNMANDTIYVAPPTGEQQIDRGNILAALDLVQPEGTIQFAPGTYLVGKGISVKVPGVTLFGHPEGTIIRGCDPAKMEDRKFATVNCNGLELAGSDQTVRGFIFEYAYWALHLGCCRNERIKYEIPDGTFTEGSAIYNTGGGHLVENNTFRFSMSGIRQNGDWEEPSIVRNNRFINNWHGVSINGNTVHLFDNSFSVPEPEKIPAYEFAWDAVKIGPPLPLQGIDETYSREGSGNIVSKNKIEGYHQGISIAVYEPGTSCRKNIISDNTINVGRARVLTPENFTLNHQIDSTFVGISIALLNFPEALGYNAAGQESFIENNIIEGNEITGAEGIGIEILHSSRNRIINNKINEITVRNPFPGNIMDPRNDALEWSEANGSGIWVSPRSDENEITGNTFKDIASVAVFIEGDRNRVELNNTDNKVCDLGTENRVVKADSVALGEGVFLRYLDFGGEGLPLIFTPALIRPVEEYLEIGARLQKNYRVLVVGRRDEGGPVQWLGVRTHAEDLLGFLDAQEIERAVFAGNTEPAYRMMYLVEEHPERVAGVVYLAGPPSALGDLWKIPASGGPMLMRLWGAGDGYLEEESHSYRYIQDKGSTLSVPALTFVNPSGMRGLEADPTPVLIVRDQAFLDEQLPRIEDPEVRAYFQRLAKDEEMQAEVERFYAEKIFPSELEIWTVFKQAFGEYLRVVELDVPVVTGYEYKTDPELIEPHIRQFLEEVRKKKL